LSRSWPVHLPVRGARTRTSRYTGARFGARFQLTRRPSATSQRVKWRSPTQGFSRRCRGDSDGGARVEFVAEVAIVTPCTCNWLSSFPLLLSWSDGAVEHEKTSTGDSVGMGFQPVRLEPKCRRQDAERIKNRGAGSGWKAHSEDPSKCQFGEGNDHDISQPAPRPECLP